MPMKNPPHPGEMIGDSLEEMGVSVNIAAKNLGITRQQLHNLIAGRSAIVPQMALRLEMAFGSTADAWLRMQANYDLAKIRSGTPALKIKRITSETHNTV